MNLCIMGLVRSPSSWARGVSMGDNCFYIKWTWAAVQNFPGTGSFISLRSTNASQCVVQIEEDVFVKDICLWWRHLALSVTRSARTSSTLIMGDDGVPMGFANEATTPALNWSHWFGVDYQEVNKMWYEGNRSQHIYSKVKRKFIWKQFKIQREGY